MKDIFKTPFQLVGVQIVVSFYKLLKVWIASFPFVSLLKYKEVLTELISFSEYVLLVLITLFIYLLLNEFYCIYSCTVIITT